jgi:hypothetical protein
MADAIILFIIAESLVAKGARMFKGSGADLLVAHGGEGYDAHHPEVADWSVCWARTRAGATPVTVTATSPDGEAHVRHTAFYGSLAEYWANKPGEGVHARIG